MSTPRPSLPDALLRQALARRAAGPSTSAELLDDVLAAVETLPQRRGWTLPLLSELRLFPILPLVAVLLTALIGLALFAGGRITPPGSSGLVAYESDGDIYVGDPATGETRAIVTGPAFQARPIFSPDGTHIAFYRSPARLPEHGWVASTASASILVVRADGSDERVIVPAGIYGNLGGFSWTPDSSSLVVNHDDVGSGWVGLLSVFDTSGVAEPRLLTPPLPKALGAYHEQVAGEVAPMFRPPIGDRIMSGSGEGAALITMDIDGSNVTELLDTAEADVPFDVIAGAIWSPDANWIVVTAREQCPRSICYGWEPNQRIYVVSADGKSVRRLTQTPDDVDPGRHVIERATAWSPDGSRILIERTEAEYLDVATLATETFVTTDQTLIVDVATGAERAIGAPRSESAGPPWGEAAAAAEAEEPPQYGRSTSWSPDRNWILVFEGPGTRPLLIDVETGASTMLPWETDWHPSWRITD